MKLLVESKSIKKYIANIFLSVFPVFSFSNKYIKRILVKLKMLVFYHYQQPN